MKIKLFILISALWANIALGERNQFAEFFNSANSLSASFSQAVYDESFNLLSSTTGTFAFQRPQQLRWHTKQPNGQILLLNNNDMWTIDIELEQAVLQKITDFSKTPLYWLINKPDSIDNTPKFSHHVGGMDWYLAKADEQALEFGFMDGLLSAITLENELGQIVSITFDQMRINPNITAKTFEPNINPDFDIIK